MIRAYDDYGNVVDLVEWEKQIRADLLMPYDVESIEDLIDNVKSKARADAFKEFVNLYREFCIASPDESCLKEDDMQCDGMCIDCFAKWVQTKNHINKN